MELEEARIFNRDADPEMAQDREFASVSALENFCEKWGIDLP